MNYTINCSYIFDDINKSWIEYTYKKVHSLFLIHILEVQPNSFTINFIDVLLDEYDVWVRWLKLAWPTTRWYNVYEACFYVIWLGELLILFVWSIKFGK